MNEHHSATSMYLTEPFVCLQVIFSDSLPFYADDARTYDSWSIGVIFLELILGTPHVFTVDQRARVSDYEKEQDG